MEQAPAKSRGLLSTAANGLAMEVGYILGGWFSVLYNDLAESSPSTWSWRLPVSYTHSESVTRAHRRYDQFVINLIPCIALLAAYPWIPESARWLVAVGGSEEALEVLESLHGSSKNRDQSFAEAEHFHIVRQASVIPTLSSHQ